LDTLGWIKDSEPVETDGKNPTALALGVLVGRRLDQREQKMLSAKKRSDIAEKSAKSRWNKSQS